MLTMKYERINFFGTHHIYTEDSIANYDKEDVRKAFLFLGKNRDAAVQRENIIYFWDKATDFENRIMTVRTFTNGMSYTDEKQAFDKVKKECYAEFQ